MRTFNYLNRFIDRRNKIFALLSVISTIISVVMAIFSQIFVRFFIDSILGNEPVDLPQLFINAINNNGGLEVLKNNLTISAVALIILYFFTSIFFFGRTYFMQLAADNAIKDLKDKLYNHIQHLNFSYINKVSTGELIQRSITDVETTRSFIRARFLELVKILVSVTVGFIMTSSINMKLALVGVALIPLIAIVSIAYSIKLKNVFHTLEMYDAELTTVAQENLANTRVVRAFGRERFEKDKYEKANKLYSDSIAKVVNVVGELVGATTFLAFLQILLVLTVAIFMAYRGEITFGTVNLFFTNELMMVFSVRDVGRVFGDFGKMQVALDRLFEILDEPVESETVGAIEHDLNGDISFKSVSFKFDDSTEHMLQNISFDVKQGETVGILGSTGSGKSTLMYLLLRLFDYDEGSIEINGVELRDIKKTCLRRKIGLVLQESFLYSRTIEENLKMAKDKVNADEMLRATEIAKVHNVIERFDKGYETFIGEKGVTLSGGQKQRVAIARTLLKENDILIFDDSLSAVDTETDAEIRRELKKEGTSTTKFIISQRITTIMEADKIIILEKGVITSIGTHKELINKDGLYKRIWDIQTQLEKEFEDEVI